MFYVWLLYELYVYGGDRRIRYDVWAGAGIRVVWFSFALLEWIPPLCPTRNLFKKQLRANK